LIARIRQRETFQRLTREGARIRRSPLWCTWCPQPDSSLDPSPAVAYAIGRAVGPAVTRNRLRRRLRAILAEAHATTPLPPVVMLWGATPAATELTFDQLRREVHNILTKITTTMASSN